MTTVTEQDNEASPSTTEAATSTATTVVNEQMWTLLAGGDVLLDLTEPEGVDPFTEVHPAL